MLEPAVYAGIFDTPPAAFQMLTGFIDELITKVLAGAIIAEGNEDLLLFMEDLTYDLIEEGIQMMLVDEGIITAGNKTTFMTALGNNGYGAGALPMPSLGGYIGVLAAYLE